MSVPPVAATWIATLLRKEPAEQQRIKTYLINQQAYGKPLQFLSQKEMKLICSSIEQCAFNKNLGPERCMQRYKHATKPVLEVKIRNALYTDYPVCQQENRAAMMELETWTKRHANYSPAALVVAPATTTPSPPASAPQIPVAPPPPQLAAAFFPTGFTMAPSKGATMPTSTSSSNNNSSNQKRNHAQAFAQNLGPALHLAMGLAPPNGLAQSNIYPNTLGGNTVAGSVGSSVVTDASKDPETTPQTPHEFSTLHQLRHMGFGVNDTREILTAYRKRRDERGTPPTPDDVLLYIVTQRERVEEERVLAADMDRARLESERSRDDAAQRRAEIQQERERQLEHASLQCWMSDAFVHSWILHSDPTWRDTTVQPWIREGSPTPIKRQLLKLLQMERNARKWYQEKLAGAYFVHVVLNRLRQASHNPGVMLAQLGMEIEILERGMYELEQQIGGVPIIFREALDAHPSADENQDEEVVLVLHKNRLAQDNAAASSASSKKQSAKNHPRSTANPCRV